MEKQGRWMVLVGPGFYNNLTVCCTETAKLYRWGKWYGGYRTARKSEYVSIIVADKEQGDILVKRLDAERRNDQVVRDAYYDRVRNWNRENPKPTPRSPQEMLAALGIQVAEK